MLPDAETEIFLMKVCAVVSGETPVIYVPILYDDEDILTSVLVFVLLLLPPLAGAACLATVMVYVRVSPLCDLQFILIVLYRK